MDTMKILEVVCLVPQTVKSANKATTVHNVLVATSLILVSVKNVLNQIVCSAITLIIALIANKITFQIVESANHVSIHVPHAMILVIVILV